MEGFIFCTFSSPTGWLDKQTNNDWAEVGEGGHSTRWVIRSTHGYDGVCCMNSFLLGIEAIVCLLTAFHDVSVSSQWKRATQTWGRRLYSYLLVGETTRCKTLHFQWIYGKLSQIYRSDQMDPKSALGGPKPVLMTGGSLLKNWNYTSN